MSRARFLGLVLVCMLAAAPTADAQTSSQGTGGFIETPRLQVSISRDRVSTQLGESFGFTSRIENTGAATWSGLVAHLNVVGLSSGIYVDPEDWSEERTKFLSPLAPRESTSVEWNVKAVTGGHAAIYVVVVPGDSPAGAPLAVSPAMDVRITETKDLNSGGVLPLALGVPAFLGALALMVRRRRR